VTGLPCPKMQVLATSREPLRVPGETTVAVRPLRLADAVELFGRRAAQAETQIAPQNPHTSTSTAGSASPRAFSWPAGSDPARLTPRREHIHPVRLSRIFIRLPIRRS
jgi:protein involved in temperature-dependent protein secretion